MCAALWQRCCVICLSCYNDSIICCCLGNRRICCAARIRARAGAFLLCEQVSVCVARWKKSHSFMNLKMGRKGLHTHILDNMACVCVCVWIIRFEKTMQTPREQTRQHVTRFQSTPPAAEAIIAFIPTSCKCFCNGEKKTTCSQFVICLWWANAFHHRHFLRWHVSPATTVTLLSWSILQDDTSPPPPPPPLLHTG